MKKILMLGAALSLLGSAALADTAGSAAPSDGTALQVLASSDGGRDVKAERHGKGEWQRHGKHAGKGGKKGGHAGMARSKGPYIVLERRGNRIEVKCAETDTTQQCVDAVDGLLARIADKMNRFGGHGKKPAPDSAPAPQQE